MTEKTKLATILHYVNEFIERATQAGVVYNTHYTITNESKESPRVYRVIVSTKNGVEEAFRARVLVLQGIIYHMSNRKWITDDSYMFIQQSIHLITFNDGTSPTV